MPFADKKETVLVDSEDTKTKDDKNIKDIQDIKELKDINNSFGFNIADHLDKIGNLLDLLQQDIFEMPSDKEKSFPLFEMIEKMLSPHIIDNLPLADVALTPKDIDDLDNIHGKIIMMHGEKHDDEPMKIHKKVIKLIPKKNLEEQENCDSDKCLEKEKKIISNISKKVRNIISDMSKFNHKFAGINNINQYTNSLKLAHQCLHKIAYNTQSDNLLAQSLYYLNPSKFSSNIRPDILHIIDGVISDLSLSPNYNYETYKNLASRVKFAYQLLLNDNLMTKVAYYEVKEENSPSKGFNICPKYKTVKGVGIPVSMDFCQRECIEGKVEDNGEVSCKYAYWLEHIADSHAKVMEKLDVHRNPDNENTYLRLPDGERSFLDRGYIKSLEKRLEESGIRGRKWDNMEKSKKVNPGSPIKMFNYEALIDEILNKNDIHRDNSGYDKNTEKKLTDIHNNDHNIKTIEQRLYNKKIDKDKSKEEGNTESKLSELKNKIKLDYSKLMDELLEDFYPRKDEKRP